MEITQLKYFLTVAKTGKIVTAAEKLFVTPPAISTSIAQLEKELGVQLFTRLSNRLQLNRQGEIFLDYVEDIIGSVNLARADIQASLGEGPQNIVVGVTSSNLWIDLIAGFSTEYPHYTLSSVTSSATNLVVDLCCGRFSFALTSAGNVNPRIAAEYNIVHLFDDYPAIMIHPDHPLAKRDSVRFSDLEGQRLIWPKTSYRAFNNYFQLFRNENYPIPQISTYSYLICQSLVAKNAAIVLTTGHAKGSSNFRFVPLETGGVVWPQLMCWRKDRELSDAEAAFKDFVIEHCHAEA